MKPFLNFSPVFWIPYVCSCTQLCIQTLISILQSLLMLIHFCKNIPTYYRTDFASLNNIK